MHYTSNPLSCIRLSYISQAMAAFLLLLTFRLFYFVIVLSISSTSSSDIPSKFPTLPHPDYSPLDSSTKPNQRYRRRTDDRDIENKPSKSKASRKEDKVLNGHIRSEHHVKTSKDTRDSIEVYEYFLTEIALN